VSCISAIGVLAEPNVERRRFLRFRAKRDKLENERERERERERGRGDVSPFGIRREFIAIIPPITGENVFARGAKGLRRSDNRFMTNVKEALCPGARGEPARARARNGSVTHVSLSASSSGVIKSPRRRRLCGMNRARVRGGGVNTGGGKVPQRHKEEAVLPTTTTTTTTTRAYFYLLSFVRACACSPPPPSPPPRARARAMH